MRSAAPVTQNHLSKPTDLMLQNATPLRKSAPWPPNISDEHVFCIALATRNASLKILFKCPTPAIVFGNATNPHVLLTLDKVHNPLRLPRETTSEPPKVARTCDLLYIFTSKCASRHNGVHFFDIATSKSGPSMVCFVHFDFEMCFAPQRRALFRHRNFQKWSEHGVFCPFWLRNVLRATTACNFSSLIWPAGSFSTLRSHKSLEKHSVSRLSYLFAHLHLLSSDSFSSLIFSLLIFLFSLPLPCSAFHLSILSEVWLLNFLRWSIYDQFPDLRDPSLAQLPRRRAGGDKSPGLRYVSLPTLKLTSVTGLR